MALFRKVIEEAQRCISKGEIDEARKILKEHIAEEHCAESDLSDIMRKLNAYQDHLIFAYRLLKIDASNYDEIDEELAKSLIYLDIAEKKFKKLIKENKFNLTIL